LELIEADVSKFIADSTVKRRDPTGMVLGLLFVAAGLATGYYDFVNDGWWRLLLLLSATLVLFGTVGFTEDAIRAKGRRVER
jgi:putative effector of murein hydrolase LrgA (UPF0299 family)